MHLHNCRFQHSLSRLSFASSLSTRVHEDLKNIILPYGRLENCSINIRVCSSEWPDVIQTFRDFLGQCRALRVASLRLRPGGPSPWTHLPDDTDWHPSQIPAHLVKLSVTIAVTLPASMSTVLKGLDLPVLNSLSLSGWGCFSSFRLIPEYEDIMKTLQHDLPFFARLKSLAFVRLDIREEQLCSVLRCTSLLEYFAFCKSKAHRFLDYTALLEFFMVDEVRLRKEEDYPPLPKLRALRVEYSKGP
ncbi:hypothetical protein NLJ89_g10158 [Agrocybe chaxingu]|uniref:Uncharacterized protein n=1 Tax=Agrocybe chaxingu TaxID=84603 RepID=A0A9W8JRU7_9AGAR|nr:hypothetical protein NLJ89_g10158 [Agrocybe chaxingu]